MSGGGGGRRRVGLFGGSFDPIHRGHLDPVRAAVGAFALDRVIYLPTARPPHKPKREFASALARFTMVELALLAEPDLVVSDHELTLGRPAYTVETVEHFAAAMPDADLHLLVGSDSFAELPTWRRWSELVARVELVVLVRPGWEMAEVRGALPPELEERTASGHVHVVSDASVDLSSTELRRTLAGGGQPPAGALEPLVLDYIRKYDLYR